MTRARAHYPTIAACVSAYFEQQFLAGSSVAQHAPPTPSLRRMISSGQNFVNEDWSKLTPTNAVNQSQYGL